MRHLEIFTRYGEEGASSRYRAYQYRSYLEQAGYSVRYASLSEWNAGRVRSMPGVTGRLLAVNARRRRGSICLFQKEPIMPPVLWPLIRNSIRRLDATVWDIDDAVWLAGSRADRMARQMASGVDVVIAGNRLIADWCHQHGASRVHVVPTCYEPRGPVAERTEHGPVRIVWIGSPATAARLKQELPLLSSVLNQPSVRLTCVGADRFDVPGGASTEFLPWTPENEHLVLSSADYGLSFLPRDEYSDHKCGFKLVQYMSYGVVPLATRSPVHEDVVGDVGLLVDAVDDIDTIAARVTSRPTPAQRAAAVERWRERFSLRAGADALLRVLAEV